MTITQTNLAKINGNIGHTNASGSVTPATGSVVTIRAMWDNGGGAAGTCTVADTAGNTWVTTNQLADTTGGAPGAGVFHCLSHVGGSTTITVTNSNAGDMMFACCYDYWTGTSGVGAKGTQDGDVNPPNDLTVVMTGTAPTATDIVLGALSYDEFSASALTWSGFYSPDFTGRQVSSSAGQTMLFFASQRLGSTSLSYVFDLTTGDEFREVGACLTLLDAGGTPDLVQPLLRPEYLMRQNPVYRM